MAEWPPLFQQDPGCYTAAQLRQMVIGNFVASEGVAGMLGGQLKVTTGASNLNLSVAEGGAFIDSDVDDKGMYSNFNDGALTLVGGSYPGVTPAHATLPRIDRVVAVVNDAEILGVDSNLTIYVLTGTPTASAQISNPLGANYLAGATSALPDRTILLAYVLVPATFTGPFVDATHIRDARMPWVESGEPSVPSTKKVRSTNQSIPNTTETLLTFPDSSSGTAEPNAFYSYSAGTFTFLKAGTYDVDVEVTWAASADANRRQITLYRNSVTAEAKISNPNINSGAVTSSFRMHAVVTVAVGETLESWLSQLSGGALNVTAASMRVTRRGTLAA